jgi:hypothetical protein
MCSQCHAGRCAVHSCSDENLMYVCTAVARQWPRDRRINNGVMQPVSKQRIGICVPATTNSQTVGNGILYTVRAKGL